MAEEVTKLNVLIASPGDVERERRIARDTLLKWNRIHSSEYGIVFQPLMWEIDVYPTLEHQPQDHINKILVEKADLAIPILWTRLGTPTKSFLSGTVEEIAQFRQNNRQVFLYFSNQLPSEEVTEEADEVQRFREQSSGFLKTYPKPDAFGSILFDDLTLWAQRVPISRQTEIVTDFDAGEIEQWFDTWDQGGEEGMLLLYNTEHHSFKDLRTYRRIWGNVRERKNIKKIVFLLPKRKIKRLLELISQYEEDFLDGEESDHFFVSEYHIGTNDSFTEDSNAVAFSLFGFGSDPERIEKVHDDYQVFILSEPFSKPLPSDRGAGRLRWDYAHVLNLGNETFAKDNLTELWERRFNPGECHKLIDLVNERRDRRRRKEGELSKDDGQTTSDFARRDDKIRIIRDQLLYPNVPSYLLDKHFRLLDWNSAFDLVFPTDTFHRGQHVKLFAKHFESSEDVFDRGMKLESKSKTDEFQAFDMEDLTYISDPFGKMEFTKMTSPVTDRKSGEHIGWNVVLNVSSVDNQQLYESEVRKVAEREAVRNRFAAAFDNIVSRFSQFKQLVKNHCETMNGAETVLDLCAGPGNLTRMLLESGKRVVAIDFSDHMLDLVRSKCDSPLDSGRLEVLKDSMEVLHSLEGRSFDGAVMLLTFPLVPNLNKCIPRIHSLLRPGALFSITIPSRWMQIDELNSAIEDEFERCRREENWDAAKVLEWEAHFRNFEAVAKNILQIEHLSRYDEDEVRQILQDTGFQIRDSKFQDSLIYNPISLLAVKT